MKRKAQPRADGGDQDTGDGGADEPGGLEVGRVQADGVAQLAGPTISETKVCRAGLSTTVTRPSSEGGEVDVPDLDDAR